MGFWSFSTKINRDRYPTQIDRRLPVWLECQEAGTLYSQASQPPGLTACQPFEQKIPGPRLTPVAKDTHPLDVVRVIVFDKICVIL